MWFLYFFFSTWDFQTPRWAGSVWWSKKPLLAKPPVASHTSSWWHSHSAYRGTDCTTEQPKHYSHSTNFKINGKDLSTEGWMLYLAESLRRLFIGCRHIRICKLLFTLATKNFIGSTERLGNSLFMAGPMAWVRKTCIKRSEINLFFFNSQLE